MRVGGQAEWLLEPATPEELRDAWRAAVERNFTPRLLGGGANLLIEDGLHPCVVLATERMRRVFRPNAGVPTDTDTPFESSVPALVPLERGEGLRLVAWCGASLLGLVRTAQELGWTGLEGLAGVPGSVGGGVTMNAGGRWGAMWDVVESVRVLRDGEFVDLTRAECAPAYRDGRLGGAVVVGAVLQLEADERAAVKARVRDFLNDKRRTQPVTESSSGCIFKNPDPEVADGRSAGALVDECGAKGLRVGAAMVSDVHANFIVNRGGATAADVFTLMERVRERVAERTSIQLETEVRCWKR